MVNALVLLILCTLAHIIMMEIFKQGRFPTHSMNLDLSQKVVVVLTIINASVAVLYILYQLL